MSKLMAPTSFWVVTKLGTLSEVKSGIGFPKKYQGRNSGNYPVYKVGDISQAVAQCQGQLEVANNYVTNAEVNALKGAVFRAGSTLFAKIGEAVKLNRRAFIVSPGLADNNVMAVIPFRQESDRYLHYFLRTIDLSDVSRSTTVPSVRKGDIEDLLVNLPSLAEQKVIADKLDTMLTQVTNTKDRLERITQILKSFRQSVLAAAVSGRLTEKWRKSKNYPLNWRTTHFSELLLQLRSGAADKPYDDTKGTPILRSSAVRTMSIDFSDTRYLDKSTQLKADNYLKKNDLLFTRLSGSAEYVGNCAMVRSVDNEYQYPDRLFCARLKKPEQGRFLEYFFASEDFRNHINSSLKSSAGHQRITLDVIKTAVIVIPPIEEQTEIVNRVDRLFAQADSIEQQVNHALAQVNNLTQSILAKAFRGELTEQWRMDNPELINGENSAETLLEKIKEERAARVTKKK